MGHIDTSGYSLPFGKHKGEPISDLPSDYLLWLEEQDWFEDKYPHLLEVVQHEYRWRDETGKHWYDKE